MHPILRHIRRLGLYLLSWIPLAAGLMFLTAPRPLTWAESALLAVPTSFLYAFVCLSGLYVCRSFPLSGERLSQNILQHILHGLIGGAFWAIAAKAIAISAHIPARSVNPTLPLFFSFGILLYLLSVASHWSYLTFEAMKTAERRTAEVKWLASQAELRALRSQINPHFLYNSLNSISALTSIDSSRARQMCIQLSEFLRTTLGLSEKEKVPLSFELDLIKRYLAIEKTRFGHRLNVEEEIAADCLNDSIPALILQPLIENAIVHGIAGVSESGLLRLVARHGSPSQLVIIVENSFDSDSPASRRHGFGLSSIRKRLEAEYGPLATLATTADGELFRAELIFPVG